jgi:hypothetical protein
MSPSINGKIYREPAPLDGVGGRVFTQRIEHTFENIEILMVQEVLL